MSELENQCRWNWARWTWSVVGTRCVGGLSKEEKSFHSAHHPRHTLFNNIIYDIWNARVCVSRNKRYNFHVDDNTGKQVAARVEYALGDGVYQTYGVTKGLVFGMAGDFYLNQDLATQEMG